MRLLLFAALILSLPVSGVGSALFADEAPGAKAAKQVPTPGRVKIQVTSGDREKSFEHPSKALSQIGRALSRARRAPDAEAPTFEAALTLNDQLFTFKDPEAALKACKTLGLAMRDLGKLRMGPGDLGEIPAIKPEQKTAAKNPMPQGKSKAARIKEVRRRIRIALRKQMRGGRRPRVPNPLMIQKTIREEIEKARKEGLLPSGTNAANVGGGFAGGDPREAKKEAIVQSLARVLGRADSVGPAKDQAKDNDTEKDKPAGEKAAEETPKEEEPKEIKSPDANPKQ